MVLYALMTFPSTYFDIPTCVKKSAEAANDQKKRVRQAALDVLAVLGQISTPKTVLEEVTETLRHEKEAHRLIAAIKARLSRKQLPSVTPEGSVHYALRIPTPPQVISSYFFGADIDWITAGELKNQEKKIPNYTISDSVFRRNTNTNIYRLHFVHRYRFSFTGFIEKAFRSNTNGVQLFVQRFK